MDNKTAIECTAALIRAMGMVEHNAHYKGSNINSPYLTTSFNAISEQLVRHHEQRAEDEAGSRIKAFRRLWGYILAALALVLACIIVPAFLPARAEAAALPSPAVYVWVSDYLTGRRDPDKNSPEETKFYAGEQLEILDIAKGEWVCVSGGEPGTVWCNADYLRGYVPGETPPVYTVVSTGRVRVRAKPDTAARVQYYLHPGETVDVRFIYNGWAFLGKDKTGKVRWVDAQYLEKSEVDENAN